MIGALVISLGLVAVSTHLTMLSTQLGDKKSEESYFMRNMDAVEREKQLLHDLDAGLHLHQMLLKLSKNVWSKRNYETLKRHEEAAQKRIQEKTMLILRGEYMLANEPPPGKTPNDLFNGLSTDEQISLSNKYGQQAFAYAKTLKSEMIGLEKKIPFWTMIQTASLALNGILILIGSILTFRAE